MQLVERHMIKKGHSLYKELDSISFLSKNLYNKANYIIRQEFIKTSKEKERGKREKANWIRYGELQKMMQDSKDFDYMQLPAKVSQQVLRTLDKSWSSFFRSIKVWKKGNSGHTGRPKLPKYKDKKNGRNILTYTIQAISKKGLKNGIILLSKTNVKIKTRKTDIQQVRVVPKIDHYVIEVVYKREIVQAKVDKNKIAGVDLGVNNLATVTSNQNVSPLLINGRPLKSMNQFYNKERARLQSFVGDKSSNKLRSLTNKRNRKVDDYLHRASKEIVTHLIKNEIGTVVIGKNKLWKMESNIGKKNNQNFINIPHARLIEMIAYKCELVGILVIIKEESYTSKCSFIDFEEMKHHENYMGYRKHRGLFITKDRLKINADCNGSGNIIRKEFPNAFSDGIEGVVVRPLRVNLQGHHLYKQAA